MYSNSIVPWLTAEMSFCYGLLLKRNIKNIYIFFFLPRVVRNSTVKGYTMLMLHCVTLC